MRPLGAPQYFIIGGGKRCANSSMDECCMRKPSRDAANRREPESESLCTIRRTTLVFLFKIRDKDHCPRSQACISHIFGRTEVRHFHTSCRLYVTNRRSLTRLIPDAKISIFADNDSGINGHFFGHLRIFTRRVGHALVAWALRFYVAENASSLKYFWEGDGT